jgi:hypothetical protein
VSGLVPPEGVTVAEPLLFPLHKTLVDDIASEGPAELEIVRLEVTEQLFASVTVTV